MPWPTHYLPPHHKTTKPLTTHPQLGLIPCDPDTCTWLEKLGRLDAMAWAEVTGIAQAAAKKLRNQKELASKLGGQMAQLGRRRV